MDFKGTKWKTNKTC